MSGEGKRGSSPLDGGRGERMADYRAGRMSAEEDRRFEREILADPDLSEDLYGDVNLSTAIETAAGRARRRVIALPNWWQRRSVQVLVPLAAAAVALLVLLPVVRPPDRFREQENFRATEGVVRILRPVGDLDELPSRFLWTRDPGAAMYRVELYDSETRLLHQSTTTDTVIVLPQGTLSEGDFRAGFWKVIPMTEAGVERPGPPPATIRIRDGRN